MAGVTLALGFSLPGGKRGPVRTNIPKGPSRMKMLGIRNHLGLHFGEKAMYSMGLELCTWLFEGLAQYVKYMKPADPPEKKIPR